MLCSRRDGPVVLLPAPGAAGAGLLQQVPSSVQQLTVLHRPGPSLLPVQHPCAAWPMQMLRCTRDTTRLQPEDHHQGPRAAHRQRPLLPAG